MVEYAIFGARSVALDVCKSLQTLYPEITIVGFLVSKFGNNPRSLAGLPVFEVDDYPNKDIHVLIATSEDIQGNLSNYLHESGFHNHTCIPTAVEIELMEKYYTKLGLWNSLHSLPRGDEFAQLKVFSAKSGKDRPLCNIANFPNWVHYVHAGATFSNENIAEYRDDEGESISYKNRNYCEMTAFYWMWKNLKSFAPVDYVGLFHYRRMLDISDDDILALKKNDIDIVLPYPMLHEPNAYEHHTRYIKESDWEAMLRALREVRPEYYEALDDIFSKPYFYNYNMMVARPRVIEEYGEWLFPILERIEEISTPKGCERSDRYIGYLSESLTTLYFFHNAERYNIAHTGRLMFT